MARYDYRCLACNAPREIERSIIEDSLAPICCGLSMNRVYDVPSVQFNAPGFYKNS